MLPCSRPNGGERHDARAGGEDHGRRVAQGTLSLRLEADGWRAIIRLAERVTRPASYIAARAERRPMGLALETGARPLRIRSRDWWLRARRLRHAQRFLFASISQGGANALRRNHC